MDDHIQGSQQNTHYPKEKFPKIITHKWKFGNLLEAPKHFQWKAFLLQNLKAKQIANYKITKKKVLNCGGYSLFSVSLNLECFLVQ